MFKILYADDTSVLIQVRDLDHIINVLYSELLFLSNWLKTNKLSLNTEKNFYMVFHRARLKHTNIKIVFDNVTLAEVASLKYLGLIIDNKLKWIEHIANAKKERFTRNWYHQKSRALFNKKSLIDLCYVFIYPSLIYYVDVWGYSSQCVFDLFIYIFSSFC